VEFHAPAAIHDGRARLPVHSLEVSEPDQRGVLCIHRLLLRAHEKRGLFLRRVRIGQMRVAIETFLARVLTRLNLNQPHVQPCVSVGREAQSAADVQ
jgi:hypothetical protein